MPIIKNQQMWSKEKLQWLGQGWKSGLECTTDTDTGRGTCVRAYEHIHFTHALCTVRKKSYSVHTHTERFSISTFNHKYQISFTMLCVISVHVHMPIHVHTHTCARTCTYSTAAHLYVRAYGHYYSNVQSMHRCVILRTCSHHYRRLCLKTFTCFRIFLTQFRNKIFAIFRMKHKNKWRNNFFYTLHDIFNFIEVFQNMKKRIQNDE